MDYKNLVDFKRNNEWNTQEHRSYQIMKIPRSVGWQKGHGAGGSRKFAFLLSPRQRNRKSGCSAMIFSIAFSSESLSREVQPDKM